MSIDATADGALLAIDFGTTTSSMAWYNPKTGRAEILKNAEGEEKTPSVVYFGEQEVLVGAPAEHLIEDETERERVIWSIKRELATRRTLALPDRRVTAVDVVREVLAKLKRDAEELHFHRPVSGLVLTYPAAFDVLEREALEQAARGAGFSNVRLLEEPVAAGLAYGHEHEDAGRNLLVYDLGGGTLDLAVLSRDDDGGFRLATEPRSERLGGDDFDRALGDLVEAEVRRQLWQSFGGLDPFELRQCRKRKEELSHREQVNVSMYVEGQRIAFILHRAEFEALIRDQVEKTARLTRDLAAEAKARGYPVETVVLIGGASRTPLVQQQLMEVLPVKPRKWHHQDVAVALGAAYFRREIELTIATGTVERIAAVDPATLEKPKFLVQDIHGWTTMREIQVTRQVPSGFLGLGTKTLHEPIRLEIADASRVQTLQRQVAEALGRDVAFRDQRKGGGDGPQMLVIPPGSFLMGSPQDDPERFGDDPERFGEEGPRHQVTISKPFALARHALSVGEFRRFVAASGYLSEAETGDGAYSWTGGGWWEKDKRFNWRTPGFEQREDHPVVCVSWNDAVTYCRWLSEETGAEYRLPSEAEWEYACRAGTTTPFWWGRTITTKQANYAGHIPYNNGPKGEYRRKTVAVDEFDPNPWGLYQMHGNIWEWVQDVWRDNYPNEAQTDPVYDASGAFRVYRGGSWRRSAQCLRAAFRRRSEPTRRDVALGLRPARTL